jgi:hypothetical protein
MATKVDRLTANKRLNCLRPCTLKKDWVKSFKKSDNRISARQLLLGTAREDLEITQVLLVSFLVPLLVAASLMSQVERKHPKEKVRVLVMQEIELAMLGEALNLGEESPQEMDDRLFKSPKDQCLLILLFAL